MEEAKEIEKYAKLLHEDSCIRRGLLPRWDGKQTNRAYWRRQARQGSPTPQTEGSGQ